VSRRAKALRSWFSTLVARLATTRRLGGGCELAVDIVWSITSNQLYRESGAPPAVAAPHSSRP
jgi:hypothetical protein